MEKIRDTRTCQIRDTGLIDLELPLLEKILSVLHVQKDTSLPSKEQKRTFGLQNAFKRTKGQKGLSMSTSHHLFTTSGSFHPMKRHRASQKWH